MLSIDLWIVTLRDGCKELLHFAHRRGVYRVTDSWLRGALRRSEASRQLIGSTKGGPEYSVPFLIREAIYSATLKRQGAARFQGREFGASVRTDSWTVEVVEIEAVIWTCQLYIEWTAGV